MKRNIFIILAFLPLFLQGQNTVGRFNSGVWSFQGTFVVYAPFEVYLSDTFNFETNKWIDQSGKGNDLDIVNSYMINTTQPGDFVGCLMQNTGTMALVDGVKFTFAVNTSTGGIVIGGTTTTNYIWITNALVLFRTLEGNITFPVGMVGDAYNTWNEYEIYVDGANLVCHNITTGVSDTQVKTQTDFTLKWLFGRGTSGNFEGKCAHITISQDDSLLHEWNFGEGLEVGETYYSIIDRKGQLNAKPNTVGAISYTLDNNYNHSNLQNGFSFFENGLGDIIRFPYTTSDSLGLVTIGVNYPSNYSKTFDCPASAIYHNNAETALNAPTGLLRYDYDNFLFNESNEPNNLLFEMIPENLNNQFFTDKSELNILTSFLIYNKPIE